MDETHEPELDLEFCYYSDSESESDDDGKTEESPKITISEYVSSIWNELKDDIDVKLEPPDEDDMEDDSMTEVDLNSTKSTNGSNSMNEEDLSDDPNENGMIQKESRLDENSTIQEESRMKESGTIQEDTRAEVNTEIEYSSQIDENFHSTDSTKEKISNNAKNVEDNLRIEENLRIDNDSKPEETKEIDSVNSESVK